MQFRPDPHRPPPRLVLVAGTLGHVVGAIARRHQRLDGQAHQFAGLV